MLCLWLLFEKYLSGMAPLPEKARWIENCFPEKTHLHPSRHTLGELKDKNKLVALAQELFRAEQDTDDDIKSILEDFLTKSLALDPHNRLADLGQWLGAMSSDQ